jgi:hypothetical protein
LNLKLRCCSFLPALLVLFVVPIVAQEHQCTVHPVSYRGWDAQEVRNEWVTLTFVPRLGGRLIQVTFGPHSYLFVNKAYEGKYLLPIPPSASAKWYNYGGDKLWPLPEGRHDEQHWPGPIADQLDDGDYAFSVLSQGTVCKVRLDGPPDPQTGLQYSRDITLQADSPKIAFHAVMKNASAHPIEWSVQSVTQYNTADPVGHKASTEIWAFTAANENSSYPGGYFVRAGNAPPSGLSVKNGLVALNYCFVENELWFDTQGGWLAIVDAASQFAMVEQFIAQKDKEYPGKATVIFYTNGSEPPDADLYYMEAEVNSPIVRLQPGETYAMDTAWYPSRAGSDLYGVTDVGVISKHLRISDASGGHELTGTFGVFFAGKLVAKFLDKRGNTLSETASKGATPQESITLSEKVTIPRGTTRVAICLIDSQHRELGILDQVAVAPGETDD